MMNDLRAFPPLFLYRMLTLVSNYRILCSALLSFRNDGYTYIVKSILQLTKRLDDFTPQINSLKIRFAYTKCNIIILVSNAENLCKSSPYFLVGKFLQLHLFFPECTSVEKKKSMQVS